MNCKHFEGSLSCETSKERWIGDLFPGHNGAAGARPAARHPVEGGAEIIQLIQQPAHGFTAGLEQSSISFRGRDGTSLIAHDLSRAVEAYVCLDSANCACPLGTAGPVLDMGMPGWCMEISARLRFGKRSLCHRAKTKVY